MNVRSRRELNTRDAANIRQFEHWQTDAPYLQMDRPDLNNTPILSDMNPINSRTMNGQNYLQNRPMKAGQDSFQNNPYFDGYAPQWDPRNAVRELRSAIYEDRFDKGLRESQTLLTRSFQNRWVDPSTVETNNLNTLNSLIAYEQLKPQMDDISRTFREVEVTKVGKPKKEEPKKTEDTKVDMTVLYAK
jgi:hypothetical protein